MMVPSWSEGGGEGSQAPPVSSTTLMKRIGHLARSRVVTSPHEPVWIEGMDLPVQDVMRHTRSMTSKLEDSRGATPTPNGRGSLTVSISLDRVKLCNRRERLFPPIQNIPLDHSFFFLPDKDFQTLKFLKLKESSRSVSKDQSPDSLINNDHHQLATEASHVLQDANLHEKTAITTHDHTLCVKPIEPSETDTRNQGTVHTMYMV